MEQFINKSTIKMLILHIKKIVNVGGRGYTFKIYIYLLVLSPFLH